MSPLRDTITREEAFSKGYRKYIDDDDDNNNNYDIEVGKDRSFDSPQYNMIMIHFSADTSHYSREKDPHYYGNY